jgi:hypothetical protein
MVPMDEETKATGMDGEKSERLRSTEEAGEPTRGTRSREGGRRVAEPVRGKGAGPLSPITFETVSGLGSTVDRESVA